MRWLVIILLLSSCKAGYYLRKGERAIAKAEQLGAVWHIDTVFTEIKVPVPEIKVDTVFRITKAKTDTFTIEKERLRFKIMRVVDTLTVEAECLPDTIMVEVPVAIDKDLIAPKPYWTIWKVGGAFLFALVIGFIVGKIVR